MNDYLTILVITAATGVGGLALGGSLAAAIRSPSDRTVSLLLRFTAGVILSLVCFDLIADALEQAGIVPELKGSRGLVLFSVSSRQQDQTAHRAVARRRDDRVFRGYMMTLVRERWNRRIAILAPSVLFACVHLIGLETFSPTGVALLLVSGRRSPPPR